MNVHLKTTAFNDEKQLPPNRFMCNMDNRADAYLFTPVYICYTGRAFVYVKDFYTKNVCPCNIFDLGKYEHPQFVGH